MDKKTQMSLCKRAEAYFEVGQPMAKPTYEGIAKNLRREPADRENTIKIDFSAFAYGYSEIPGAHQIITGGIGSCIVVAAVAQKEDGNLGFMAHIWAGSPQWYKDSIESLTRIVEMGATEMMIFGGNPIPLSARIVAVIEGFLMVEDPPVKVVGRNFLGFSARSSELGLDTAAEEPFFCPTNWPSVEMVEEKKHMFNYGGVRVAPIETFLELAKRK
jgi:hypothetical protein